jgi:hypothetical protein
MKFHIQRLGTEWETVFTRNVKQQTIVLVGNIHMLGVGRKRQTRRFIRIHVRLQNRKILALVVAAMNAGAARISNRNREEEEEATGKFPASEVCPCKYGINDKR